MNLSLIALTTLFFFFQGQDEKYPNEFRLGQFTYVIDTRESYGHDEDFTATFFIVFRKTNKVNHISSYKIGGYKGKRSTYGSYKIVDRFIEFKEVYSNNATTDSMTKRFYPDRKGDLILTECTDFKDGTAKSTKL
jgi:hypothetical protein